MNLANHLARTALRYPQQPGLAVGDRVVATWEQMAGRVARLAGGLIHRLGLKPGDRVALVLKNTPAYAELMYACWHAGLVVLPINSRLHPREIAYILEHSGSRVVFASSALAGGLALTPELRIIDVESADYPQLTAGEPIGIAPVSEDDVAWLFYTSGTTGRPKGAMLTHRNLLAMALSYFIDIDPPSPGGCLIHAAPMSHGSGLYMIPHAMQGNCQVLPESGGFDPGEIFRLLHIWPGASMFASPTMVNRLVAHDAAATAHLDHLRVIVFGGAPMYVPDLRNAIARLGFKFAQLYGQGETPMTITGMTRAAIEKAYRADDRATLASVGAPHAVAEVRVVDAEDRALPAGSAGEVTVRGASVMKGYWLNPEATATALRGGWLHTGDIGVFDLKGSLTLKDRSNDLIISGGSNIYPREVEDVLLMHPSVAEVSVIGVPDREWGENVLAFVVAKAGATVASVELDQLCLDNLARFKRPKRYCLVGLLPKNSNGKILKNELRAQAERA